MADLNDSEKMLINDLYEANKEYSAAVMAQHRRTSEQIDKAKAKVKHIQFMLTICAMNSKSDLRNAYAAHANARYPKQN